jgi:hypothetical protein
MIRPYPKLKMMLKLISRFFEAAAHYTILTVAASLISLPVLLSWATGTLDVLIQTIKSPTPLWASIALVLLCCVYIYLKSSKNGPLLALPAKTGIFKIDEIQERILVKLSIGGFGVKHLAEYLKMPHTLITFYLNELLDLDFVKTPVPYTSAELWSISQEGTRYLINKGLIEQNQQTINGENK